MLSKLIHKMTLAKIYSFAHFHLILANCVRVPVPCVSQPLIAHLPLSVPSNMFIIFAFVSSVDRSAKTYRHYMGG